MKLQSGYVDTISQKRELPQVEKSVAPTRRICTKSTRGSITPHRNIKSKITYLLTPCCRVLLEKLTGFQLVKAFSAFYGNRRFITAFTGHLSLS